MTFADVKVDEQFTLREKSDVVYTKCNPFLWTPKRTVNCFTVYRNKKGYWLLGPDTEVFC